ncbi:MAG: Crp/Fnr family transcriptional regulator [Flavobacterium psychrophilum]|nr:MAG: Crp/Fnr family transcriptional regulator [Flavobacterium psychrophilum]
MLSHLLHLIEQYAPLSSTDKALCADHFEPLFVPKNRIIEESGKTPKYLYFITSGYVRLFEINEKGDDITTHINCPPGFITPYSSFITGTISNENLESITECNLLRVSKLNLDMLISKSPAIKDFSIQVFQQSLSYNEKRAKELATLSADKRYLMLMKNNPDILHNVPLQHIASFLGMNPKSLSRIRNVIGGKS